MTPHHDVTRRHRWSPSTRPAGQATATVADPQVRHRGTLGGALAHADPAGDLAAPALALDGEDGHRGARTAPAPWRRRTSSSTTSPPRSATASSSPRSGSRSTPGGGALREVQPGRPGLVDRRGGRGGRRSTGGAHRRGPRRADQHGAHPGAGAAAVESALVGQPTRRTTLCRPRPRRPPRAPAPPSDADAGSRLPRAPRQGAHRSGRPAALAESSASSRPTIRSSRRSGPPPHQRGRAAVVIAQEVPR